MDERDLARGAFLREVAWSLQFLRDRIAKIDKGLPPADLAQVRDAVEKMTEVCARLREIATYAEDGGWDRRARRLVNLRSAIDEVMRDYLDVIEKNLRAVGGEPKKGTDDPGTLAN